ncbi:fas apoptotic inhibitory molecule 3 isoform X2 [Moschus berezovskii]|uniref:fas apoptotic inhibitory molecule 3 isoform X2 n=1 Tax=Moschus berezovskii TaxID=68408 RepID=UPI002443DC8D|nr:fas apoptotic inhibitory molecule 3 isoform X2 [Moschus berezovskii]
MDLWLWALYFLPVGAPKFLPEVKMEGKLGGSVIIECPLPEMHVRIYLCRTIDKSGRCTTVVSSSKFVREEFKHRVSLEQYPDRNLFLVEMTGLTKSDSGVYACGVGRNTDRGKTQQITLTVHSVYEPSWEEEPMPESPAWFNRFLQMHMSPWFQMPAQASSLEFVSKVTTPAQRTESPQAHQASATPSVTHRPRISRASSVATAEPTIFLPSITASKTSAQKGLLRLQTASNNHQTRLHRQKASNQSPGAASGMEDQGVFVLIPTILGLILLALLGLLAKRIVQRRKALSRRVRRLAVRMRALDASQRVLAQRPRVSRRPRTPNNIYSACPRRPRGVDAAGGGVAPPPGPEAPSASAPPQEENILFSKASTVAETSLLPEPRKLSVADVPDLIWVEAKLMLLLLLLSHFSRVRLCVTP